MGSDWLSSFLTEPLILSLMAPPDTATELARRVAAQILFSETLIVSTEEIDVVAVLGELLALGK